MLCRFGKVVKNIELFVMFWERDILIVFDDVDVNIG